MALFVSLIEAVVFRRDSHRLLGQGYCATTDGEGDCANGLIGSWSASQHGITNLAQCAAKCRTCSACNYVSFSRKNNDCSWFAACATPLQHAFGGLTYRTAQVHNRTVARSRVLEVTARNRADSALVAERFGTIARGTSLDESQIYDGYEQRLEEAVRLLRRTFRGPVIVRTCFAGVRDSRTATQPQLSEVRELNARLMRVARRTCAPVLDVFAIDELAGVYSHPYGEEWHSPKIAEQHAALAALLMLRSYLAEQ